MLPTPLAERVNSLNRSFLIKKGHRDSIANRYASYEKEVLTLEKRVQLLEKVSLVIAQLVDKMVQKDLQGIDSLVNYGLKVVFPDRSLVFKSSMVMVGGKMQVDFTTLDDGKEICDDAYGSVSVIESLLLRIICMMKTKSGKLLLLDETFGALDSEYVQLLGSLLKTLSAKTNLDILLVTFNGFLSDADTLLRARLNKSTRELSITEVTDATPV